MRKHIFTLGLLLSSFCIMPTMADYPNVWAKNVWTDAKMETDSYHARLRCTSCCGTEKNSSVKPEIPVSPDDDKVNGFVTKNGVTCWLPNGTYYMRDPRAGSGYNKQLMKFSMYGCTEETSPVCIENQTYTITSSNRCVATCNRDGGTYDIGIDVCVDSTWNGYSYGHIDGFLQDSPESFVWTVVFHNSTLFQHDFMIQGIAACSDDSKNTELATTTLQQGDKTGKNCFCRMIGVSQASLNNTSGNKNTYWEKVNSYNDVNACASSCASKCGYTVQTDPDMRKTMYKNYAL
ncbi:MAG: hypothetical protein MJ170_03720 [Alphaproteobacteria bacterium]|nr:hypothetical protein [Alphaproteobacteria bacterium]